VNKSIIGGLVALCLFTFNVSKSYSQTPIQPGCQSLDKAKKQIEDKHGEKLIFRGLSHRGHITFIYYNDTSGTWSAVIVRPETSNLLCMVDAGSTGETIHKDKTIKW